MTSPQELQDKVKLGIEKARTNSRLLVAVGAGLIVVSFLMSWWGVEKYRVYEQRGVNLASPGALEAITEKMTPEAKKEYNDRVISYMTSWEANKALNHEFYLAALGQDYHDTLNKLINVSLTSGKLTLYGWSTWTGRFGFLFVLIGAAWFLAPKIKPELEEFAWTVPWVWTALGAVLFISAMAFYFTVPDQNGDGYSQGLSLGCYLAIAGSLAVIVGGTFEGIKSARDRLALLAARAEEEDDDDADDDSKPAARRGAPKAPPVDEYQAAEEAKRKRLQDW